MIRELRTLTLKFWLKKEGNKVVKKPYNVEMLTFRPEKWMRWFWLCLSSWNNLTIKASFNVTLWIRILIWVEENYKELNIERRTLDDMSPTTNWHPIYIIYSFVLLLWELVISHGFLWSPSHWPKVYIFMSVGVRSTYGWRRSSFIKH